MMRAMTGRLFVFLLLALSLLAHGAASAAAADKPARSTPLRAGEIAPDFTLEDADGRRHSLAAQRGKSAVVLVFYRGYW